MVYRLFDLPRVMIHVIQRQIIRGISSNGVTVHHNIRDIFPSRAAPTGNATNVAAAGTLEETNVITRMSKMKASTQEVVKIINLASYSIPPLA